MSTTPLIREDIEQGVLGCFAFHPEQLRTRREGLKRSDFSEPQAKIVFDALCAMSDANEGIDLVTLYNRIAADGKDDGTVFGYIMELGQSQCAKAMLAQYITILKEASARRYLLKIGDRVNELAQDPTSDTQEIISGIRESLNRMSQTPSGWVDQSDVLISAFEDIEQRSQGKIVPCVSGLSNLDRNTGGFFPGEFTIIGARPSVGKTAFAMNIATSSALKGRKVCFVSAEMVQEQVGTRILADASGVTGQKLRTAKGIDADDWAHLSASASDWSCLTISWLFTRDVDEIIQQVRQAHEKGMCEMLIVDYIQLLTVRKRFEADRLRVGYISAQLKALSTELKIPVIGLAQLTRPNSGAARLPRLESLKDSGALEQDADNVILMHRVEDEEDDCLTEQEKQCFRNIDGDDSKRLIVLNVAKQRQGVVGLVSCVFDGSRMRYAALDFR